MSLGYEYPYLGQPPENLQPPTLKTDTALKVIPRRPAPEISAV